MLSLAPAFIVLTPGGAALAARLKESLPGALVFARRGRIDSADVFFDDFTAQLQAAFLDGRPLVGICAAGTLIRALAPVVADKQGEPPVIAVAEDGGAVVPLLGGHRGANDLAKTIAAALGIEAAVTTASPLPSTPRRPAGALPIRSTTRVSPRPCSPARPCVSMARRPGSATAACRSTLPANSP